LARPTDARHDPVIPKHLNVASAPVLHPLIRVVTNPGGGCRIMIAISNALVGRRACKDRSSDHPTTLREKVSRTTAKYMNSVFSSVLFCFLIQVELEFLAEFRFLATARWQPTQPAKKRIHRPS
jgi:hypothetical protein